MPNLPSSAPATPGPLFGPGKGEAPGFPGALRRDSSLQTSLQRSQKYLWRFGSPVETSSGAVSGSSGAS